MSKSFLNAHKVRGLRNNNPGNLKFTAISWQGKIPIKQNKDKVFEQFENITFGLRAMMKDLINDINKGKNTVKKLISEYAPASENNTTSYINSVCKSIGVTPDEKITAINRKFLLLLSRAIIRVELGDAHKEVADNDIEAAIDNLGNVSTVNLKVNTSWIRQFTPALLFFAFFF
ncbi:hypothetical protein [Flavobacterium laiguense]|uniref:Uncharacterized protein n=1 Tax=Flavobacterium laiguense TaxID=2169409 RepID=A0A2U1JUZ5_9FLAO|nr:hypothetical protein [Flavobacterium laiguense]PWA08972.1 hypothetical protein DB891_09990 [Flavobacterium laiguense]